MQRLRGKNLLLVGFTLFSMFFGAGNLIFPPFLGAQAGTNTWPAMAGFILSAIGFPVLGVIAVAKADGLRRLAGRVHPVFAAVFTLLVYLSIGPGLAIPDVYKRQGKGRRKHVLSAPLCFFLSVCPSAAES